MAEAKNYIPKSRIKARKFASGNEVLNVSVQAQAFIAWIKANTNAGGYINMTFAPRREPGRFGDTHLGYLDTFVPKANDGMASDTPMAPVRDDEIPF